jgi:hypothetical protein
MSTKCEICNKEILEENFQNHLFDEHHLLFCQYIGLLSNKLSFENFVIRPTKRVPKQKKKNTKEE